MKIYPITRPIQRYIALDIHKEYVFAGVGTATVADQDEQVWRVGQEEPV